MDTTAVCLVNAMFDKMFRILRWTTAGVLGVALALWLVAVAFALLGFRRTAEAINEVLLDVLPVAFVLLATLIVVFLVSAILRWLRRPTNV